MENRHIHQTRNITRTAAQFNNGDLVLVENQENR